MRTSETYIHPESEFYTYTPSAVAKQLLLYPIAVGEFEYLPGYHLSRGPYDSILLLAVLSGEMVFEIHDTRVSAKAGSIVLLDCFEPQTYYTNTGAKTLWIHFNSPAATNYYSEITKTLGNVIAVPSFLTYCEDLHSIFLLFSERTQPSESYMSLRISSLLARLMTLSETKKMKEEDSISSQTQAYIAEHLKQDLSIITLADNVSLSPYHFLRRFKEETGITPHSYILSVRMDMARYLLNTTQMSIHEISEATGFTSESIFCQAFKKAVGISPGGYRKSLP